NGEKPMPDRMHTAAPTSGDVGGLVAGKTLLDAIEIRFRLADAGPSPLSVDGRRLGHRLPTRRIPLPELASILMHPSTLHPPSDQAWRLLVTQARTGQATW